MIRNWVMLILLGGGLLMAQPNPELQALSKAFWEWRFVTQPATGDDILRVERPDGWQPDFSPAKLVEYDAKYRDFRRQLDGLSREGWSRSDSVDFLCLRSAMERVNWELNVLRLPYRNPDFYVHQTLGALYELLLIHTPITGERAKNMITRLQSFPATVKAAQENLNDPVGPFADIALEALEDVRGKLNAVAAALKPQIERSLHKSLDKATKAGIEALENYQHWLREKRPGMSGDFSCGREAYEYFLKNIAMLPYTPEELLEQGRQEWQRSVSFETFEKLRNREVPPDPLFPSAAAQIEAERRDEEAIRQFLEEKDIMSVPDWLQHYLNKKMPDHITPLAYMGVVDDLTSDTRLHEDAVSYIPEPSPDLSYFRLATAKDPRPIIVHEGVPGHYFQMAISWANPNPVRRRYIDSGANEGIGFYVEELLLQFGLFDNKPHTREIIYNFMRLRALRVEIDIQLALGNFTIEQAGEYLAKTVPMDKPTAVHEAGFFAYNPGQAITYQIGKLQIVKFLSDAKIQLGEQFNLRRFHDYLMENGNVPIALLRWEYLGLDDEVRGFFE